MKNKNIFFRFLIGMLFLFLSTFIQDVGASKIPISISDFSIDKQGWITHDLSNALTNGDPTSSWYWMSATYWGLPSGYLAILGGRAARRDSWAISPIIDLANVTDAEFFMTFAQRLGTTSYNQCYIYVQDADSINTSLVVDSAFNAQWGTAVKINLDQTANEAQLGIPNTNPTYDGKLLHTSSAQNLSMFDGKKIRFGIHFWNQTSNTNNGKCFVFKLIEVAGTMNDIVSPDVNVPKIDSIGNTFARGQVITDGITKVSWGVKLKGQSAPTLTDLVQYNETSAFVTSGVVQVNSGGREVAFDIKGLIINTEYTLFYGGADFSGNVSGVKSIDFKTGNDLVAPIIQSIGTMNLSSTSIAPQVVADEMGTLNYRLYLAGWEPHTVEEFNTGANNVRIGTIKYDTVGVAKTLTFNSLTPNAAYVVYATVTDFTGNVSNIFKSAVFTTPADTIAPVITSITVSDVGNHIGTLKLTCTEPAAGYGSAYVYWVATAKGAILTKEDVIARKGALASGISAKLDSATRVNNIPLSNLIKGTEYTIHAVVQDASLNVSAVSTFNITTTLELESALIFRQDFNVLNQNYHFLEVVVPAGKSVWSSVPTTVTNSGIVVGDIGFAQAKGQNAPGDPIQDAWCMIGPINLTGMVDVMAELTFRASFGSFQDHLEMWVSKSYKSGDVHNINNWTKISEAGDAPANALARKIQKVVPAGFDTAGVYIGVRFTHGSYGLTYQVYKLDMMGKSIGGNPIPIIDYVEAVPTTSTTAKVTFAASNFGRGFYYLVKDSGTSPVTPTVQQVVGGDGAAVSGYYDYTTGNYSDQTFDISGLEPNTKYHLFTSYCDLTYNNANDVYYDPITTVFQTPALNLLSLKDSLVYSTNIRSIATASTPGKIYWTVKGATDIVPTTSKEIISSFSSRGSLTYSSIIQEASNWTVSNLKPDSSYVCYAILTDAAAKYSSTIQSFPFRVPKLEILTAQYDPAVVSNLINMTYSIPFRATASCNGKLYVTLTEINAAQPLKDSVMAGKSGFASASITINTPEDIILEVSNLSAAQSTNFNAWLVLQSGNYVSEMVKLSTSPNSIGSLTENSNFELWSKDKNVILNVKKGTDKDIRIMDITGRTLIERRVNVGQNQIGPLKAGVYLVMVQFDNQIYTNKVVVK